MKIEQKSIFKTDTTTTLFEYLFNTLLSEVNKDVDYLFRQEYILYQNEKTKTKELNEMEQQGDRKEKVISLRNHISAFHRYYSYEDIIETEALLNFFEVLEDIKYSNSIVQCTHLLHKYLYSSYTLNNFFTKDTQTDFSAITVVDLNTPLCYGDSILPIWDEYKSGNRVNSIEEHFKNFLSLENNSKELRKYTLIRNIQRKNNQDSHRYNPKYYLPINQIPEFLFSFLFYDGREFPTTYGANDNNKIPKRSTKKKFEAVASEATYKFVLKHIYSFYQSNFTFANDMQKENKLRYSKINYQNKLDKLFRYNTLEMLYHYYNLYTSDIFLNHMMSVFSLSYKETLKLAEHVVHCIFDDTDFIKEGLRSSFRDFLLPFDIYFQYTLLTGSSLKGLNGLEEEITMGKRHAQARWKEKPSYNLTGKILYDIDFTNAIRNHIPLNIEFLQNRIISILETNRFYKTYFNDRNEVWIRYLESSDNLQGPISYQTLKEVLIPQ